MVSKRKKIIILSIMAVLLVATGVLNVVLNNASGTVNTSTTLTSANFFSTYRMDRQTTRDQEILYLDAIITSTASSEEAVKNAQEKKEQLIDKMDQELVCEGLIKARGFEDCIVSSTSSSINVVVKASDLSSSQVVQIVSVVRDVCSASEDVIKIIPFN